LEFGFGYADYDRIRGYVQVSRINLFGTGRSVSLRAYASRVEQRYTLNYTEPWIFSRDLDGRLGLEYAHQLEVSYILDVASVSAGLDKTFTDSLRGILIYQYEHDYISNVDPAIAPQISPEALGRFNIASINPILIFDTRDNPYNPTRGFSVELTFRDAAKILGSEKQFLKETVKFSEIFPLKSGLILALSQRGGAARPFGESTEVPLSELFLAGGRSTVRGYDQDKLGIQGVTIVDNKPTGGGGLLIFNEELRLNLPYSIGLVFFFDHGNVWPKVDDIRFDQIKSTTGAGIRYNTPVGPLRLDYGYKLNREEGESRWALHFTLGHAF
jgi:outer membrane protein insertion porin family